MRSLVIWVAAALMLLGCASTENSVLDRKDAGDRAMASNKYFLPYDTVLQATRRALDETGIRVIRDESLGAAAMSLWVDTTTVPSGNVRRVVVEGVGPRETMVHLMAERSFLKPWSSKPDWAEPLFIHIFEVIP